MVSAVTPPGMNPHDDKAKQALAADRKQSVLLRAQALQETMPELSGFEDANTRSLILATQALRKAGMASLRPLLPLLLQLKGKPYTLDNYFPFEPFFRTRMPKTVLLKTGRQVSKCFSKQSHVMLGDGRWVKAHELKVGDSIMARAEDGTLRPQRITKVWDSGVKDAMALSTKNGYSTQVSVDHRVLVRDSDNHIEEFRCASDIFKRDYVVTVDEKGQQEWSQVYANEARGRQDMIDIEVETDHTFVCGDFVERPGGIVTHNSTSLAAQGVVFSNSIPYFSTLYVTPLFEMVRRFSHNYVRQFLEESPARRLFLGSKTMNSVLQRNFKNGSAMYFSYAFLDAERTRGIPADKNVIDEVQDMNYDFLQIIHETLSGSPYALKQYAGTPKSLDNTIEKLWQDSSQAEWMIKCHHGGCNHWNVPAADWDLREMIGPWHRDISEKCPGVVCAMCQKPLMPRTGRWVHRHPERRWSQAGYHVPQIIMPMHYGNHEKWDALKGKEQGRANTTPTTFLNEVCGESCDAGSKLVTVTELKAACILPWPNRAAKAKKKIKQYVKRIVSVDWGGGGGSVRGSAGKTGEQKRERTSFTTIAVLGMLPNGKIDVIWGHRSVRSHDWEYEARLVLEAMKEFECSHIAHDYSNAGEGRLVMLYQSGLPPTSILNMRYQGFGHNILNYHEATDDHPHDWWALDKARSLVTTCMCIKYGLIRFFEYDYVSADQAGLLEDFLALIEEKVDSRLGSDTYVIVRNPNKSDDFAHSVNMGACCLWNMTGNWPNIAEAAKFQISKATMKMLHPQQKVQWDDI